MSSNDSPKVSADSILRSARAAKGRGLPPVHSWNPPFCGDLDMRIARDGTWFYQGTPIGRPEMVRLFSTILRRDGDAYFLVTPVEKVGLTVEDAPFVAVDFEVSHQGPDQVLTFVTNVGDSAGAGSDHPLRVTRDPDTGEPAPYVLVRDRLEALIDRKSFYRLVELGTTEAHEGADWFGIRSGGQFFPIIPANELTGS
ncbi:DUF1285 domain-containing protein [Pseudooceanicola sp. CBS1P-1]|uniref:DUF1285 domain-containing protein n=1 Tax=Pseudooceanicola albus TaxID=2692189 RepID=A0A6L7FWR9_9RHOB|nr:MULTISPECIES: DUF1285 domain-containing protein [Pseudooceanicola]MBT9384024.1 DUF1285 domain-containing protein [Pseudooceanicola endophyticus]MXN16564.1 DUF1285 domain-containing protein [Pseudooceanicola albus]